MYIKEDMLQKMFLILLQQNLHQCGLISIPLTLTFYVEIIVRSPQFSPKIFIPVSFTKKYRIAIKLTMVTMAHRKKICSDP